MLKDRHLESSYLVLGSCRNDEAEKKAGGESAQVSSHADLRSDKVEGHLHEDDDEDVAQAFPGEWQMTVAKEKAHPGADDAHNAAGSADELERSEKSKFR